jgi:hypothetical protein
MLRMRIEGKCPIAAVRWRGGPGRSEEGPRDIVIRADFLAGGVEGFARVAEGLLRAAP